MAKQKVLAKSIILILLIVILVLFGLLWFDYLGVIQAKSMFGPLYKAFGKTPQTTTSTKNAKDDSMADLDNDRFAKRLEALDAKSEVLDKRESEVKQKEDNNAQIAAELQDKEATLTEKENTFNNYVKKYDDRNKNIQTIVANLNGMQPDKAVAILLEMDDQEVIDILREADSEAQANGTSSMSSYWLSLMPASRAAEIQRKMANKPLSVN